MVSAYENVVNYACREWVDEVFIHTTGKNVHIEKLGNYTVSISSINVATPVQLFAKRALDIIEGIVGCICTLVIYIVIAPKIKKNLLIRELPVCGK